CLITATCVANAEQFEVQPLPDDYQLEPLPIESAPFVIEPLHVLQPLPERVQLMPDWLYEQWAKLHNHVALEEARERAAEYNKRQQLGMPTLTRNYEGDCQGNWYNNKSNSRSRTTLRTFDHEPWSGGPVLLLNPYCR
ncbi:MAG: hypothetical protein ACXAEN_26270, partial [Candidatus Thorarchaeota archaeon]